MKRDYDDMLYLEHPTSKKHPRMSDLARAAQFSPFAALTGYEGQIGEASHVRCNKIALSEEEKYNINEILIKLKKRYLVSITHFIHNEGTDGTGHIAEGEYIESVGEILKLSPEEGSIQISSDDKPIVIKADDITSINILRGMQP